MVRWYGTRITFLYQTYTPLSRCIFIAQLYCQCPNTPEHFSGRYVVPKESSWHIYGVVTARIVLPFESLFCSPLYSPKPTSSCPLQSSKTLPRESFDTLLCSVVLEILLRLSLSVSYPWLLTLFAFNCQWSIHVPNLLQSAKGPK